MQSLVIPPQVFAVADKVIYADTGNAIFAIENDNVHNIYQGEFSSQELPSSIANGVIYINAHAYNNGTVDAIDIATQSILWRYKHHSALFSTPIYHNNLLYFNNEYRIIALDAHNGKVAWELPLHLCATAISAISDGTFYLLASDHQTVSLYAIDCHLGTITWETSLPFSPLASLTTPHIVQDTIIVSSQHACAAFSKANGVLLWERQELPFDATLAISEQGILFNHTHSDIMGWDTANNCVLMEEKEIISFWSPINGTTLWHALFAPRHRVPVWMANSAIVTPEGIYAIIREYEGSTIYCISLTTGLPNWRYHSEHGFFSTPFLSDGTLYTGSNDGCVYAFHAQNGSFLWKIFVSSSLGVSAHTELTISYRDTDSLDHER